MQGSIDVTCIHKNNAIHTHRKTTILHVGRTQLLSFDLNSILISFKCLHDVMREQLWNLVGHWRGIREEKNEGSVQVNSNQFNSTLLQM